jgi:hypothetical protein
VNKWEVQRQIIQEWTATKALSAFPIIISSDHWGVCQGYVLLLISAEHPFKYFEHFAKYNHASLFRSRRRKLASG